MATETTDLGEVERARGREGVIDHDLHGFLIYDRIIPR